LQSNIAAHFQQSVGDAKAAMKEAPVVVKHRFKIGRVSCLPIETRGLLAKWDFKGAEPELEVYAATQSQHEMRSILSKLLNLPEQNIRVIAPDVGGAFGAKAIFYVEDFLITWAAKLVKAPIRWIEDRMEHMMSCIH
ncbi:molybdopterin-dependent oxidoreductase, partial [Salmonella enterica subsp. enterica serovar Typhimurium]